ncbi:transposase zinc-binding domain-containing protein [Methylotuvimicrobium sp. KM1]|uniref:transposase zinc-binding domain-containing protein n=1 Tax=Methylotuvimicrobium sp. KM1 TaxID=3377707 RepID=UPI003850D0F7
MKQCRTTHSPVMQAQCEDCVHQDFIPHSCGHRHCPHCQQQGSSRPSLVYAAFRLLSIRANNGWSGN